MKISLTILLPIILTLTNCSTNGSFDCNCDTSHLSYNDSMVNLLLSDTGYNKHQTEYYNLTPLDQQQQESYRLSMRHSFSRYSQYYTLSKTKFGASLEVRQYYDDRESEIQLDKKYTIDLSKSEWGIIKNQIDSSCFWTNKIGKEICDGCLDGGTWFIQAYSPDKQNCANRESTIDACKYESNQSLGKLCKLIRTFANEDTLDIY